MIINVNEVKVKAEPFRLLTFAKSYAQRTQKPSFIFLGDDSRYWVTNARDAKTLRDTGKYEELNIFTGEVSKY